MGSLIGLIFRFLCLGAVAVKYGVIWSVVGFLAMVSIPRRKITITQWDWSTGWTWIGLFVELAIFVFGFLAAWNIWNSWWVIMLGVAYLFGFFFK